ncbi:hypothetical protein [Fodinibius saliphilus]|uniref:hypothetical protein n=1 Tax=Fodinibius saliphilus TaxID=1920650 RepID=UPI0011081907|nr:hypothetical protein [Fodinibius saliphilus]
MFYSALNTIKSHVKNIPGWRTNRKIVVIESDDWGSIRMPSREVYQECIEAEYNVDQNTFERFDSLASESDLELLFDVLHRHKDQHGSPAVMTANILTANPDFNKIKESGYNEYYYEPIKKTFKNYPNHSNCLSLWKDGKEEGIFFPQSHGREHLNVSLFMEALQEGDEDVHFGFKHKMPGSIPKNCNNGRNKYVESLRYSSLQDRKEKLSILLEGLELFEELMGYNSKTFIPPNYLWSPNYDKAMSAKGVWFYQGRRKMKEPLFDGTIQFHTHWLGEENEVGQKYLLRNASFEPASLNTDIDPVEKCLNEVSVAFRMKKPAVIDTHRVNYVGFIDTQNRDKNLRMFDELLFKIIKRWPEVEFFNSEQLGKLMLTNE